MWTLVSEINNWFNNVFIKISTSLSICIILWSIFWLFWWFSSLMRRWLRITLGLIVLFMMMVSRTCYLGYVIDYVKVVTYHSSTTLETSWRTKNLRSTNLILDIAKLLTHWIIWVYCRTLYSISLRWYLHVKIIILKSWIKLHILWMCSICLSEIVIVRILLSILLLSI